MRGIGTSVALLLIWILPKGVYACDFIDVLAGSCPTGELTENLSDNPGQDHAVAASEKVWTNWPEFSKLKQDQYIDLRVCAYLAPPQRKEFDNEYLTIDFSQNSTSWSDAVQKVEKTVIGRGGWTAVRGRDKIGGVEVNFDSRIRLTFKDSSGQYLPCESNPNAHIRVAFSQNKNLSVVGIDGLKNARTRGSSPGATMLLSLGDNAKVSNLDVGTILHEFGHALGFVHEMRHPEWAHCTGGFLVAEFLKDNSFGNKKDGKVDLDAEETAAKNNVTELGNQYGRLSASSPIDLTSIMTYPLRRSYFDKSQTYDDCDVAGRVTTLSKTDMNIFLRYYAHRL